VDTTFLRSYSRPIDVDVGCRNNSTQGSCFFGCDLQNVYKYNVVVTLAESESVIRGSLSLTRLMTRLDGKQKCKSEAKLITHFIRSILNAIQEIGVNRRLWHFNRRQLTPITSATAILAMVVIQLSQ
jgi:hypothetical protein